MTGAEFGWQTAGLVFQVLGLVLAAVGIGQAWAEHALPGDSLAARIVGPPVRFIWTKVLRQRPRPRVVTGTIDSAIGVESAATIIATRGLRPDGTTDDHVRQVKAEVDQAWTKANEAHAAAERAQAAVDRLAAYVDRQDGAVQEAERERERAETVEGIPWPWSAWSRPRWARSCSTSRRSSADGCWGWTKG